MFKKKKKKKKSSLDWRDGSVGKRPAALPGLESGFQCLTTTTPTPMDLKHWLPRTAACTYIYPYVDLDNYM